ncbi:hypothetical protein [Edaphobacter aggregans]|uniref:hypothetical protein n=1 Tax=Edaphobacter aggregans TaxID=570835 RepID=UPI001B80D4D7|nr:hypothetical protein [Edaphobacter aggregans]
MKKIRKRSASWLAKSARRGFRGYPIATVALYGPTADLATKIAVSIIPDERKPPDVLERWFSEDIDVRHDPVVGEQIKAFLRQHQARSVVVTDPRLRLPARGRYRLPRRPLLPALPVLGGPRPLHP